MILKCRAVLAILMTVCFTEINGQASWNPSTVMSRVPGLHQVGGTMVFPQFLTMNMRYSGSSQQPACSHVSSDCPEECRKVNRGCRVCDCSETRSGQSTSSCPEPPLSCQETCRKRDNKGCKICSCGKSSSLGSNSYSTISSSVYKNCNDMIMCMLSCKDGYTLGAVTNNHGCQTCKCINSQAKEDKQTSINKANSNNKNWEEFGSKTGSSFGSISANRHDQNSGSAWQNGASANGSTWNSHNQAGNSNKKIWGNSASSSNLESNNGNDVWGANNGEASSGCSGPFCPGNSGEMNPMFPGLNSNSGGVGAASGSCTGPFCAGQGGGMGSSERGDTAGCTGPFCTMGGSAGQMGGVSGGMGGLSGGALGGSGGVGAFSPFGLAASAGRSNTGCSGPFCTMAIAGGSSSSSSGGAMTSSFGLESSQEKVLNGCTGTSCSAKSENGYQLSSDTNF